MNFNHLLMYITVICNVCKTLYCTVTTWYNMCISSYIELQSPNVYFYVHGDLVQPNNFIWSIIYVSYLTAMYYNPCTPFTFVI